MWCLLQLVTSSLTVVEGSDYGEIRVRSNVPPQLFCPAADRHNCTVRLHIQTRDAKEKKCHDKRTIPQTVLLWQGADGELPFCGVTVSKASWDTVHSIRLKGVVDSLKDKDQKQSVDVWVKLATATWETRIDIGSVKVNHCSISRNGHVT